MTHLEGNTNSKRVSILDPRRMLPVEYIDYDDDVITDHYKTEYTFDAFGNWTRSVDFKLVTKFGKSYYVPVTAVVRLITYRTNSSSTDKVRRKRTRRAL